MAKNTSKKIKELKGVKPEKLTDDQLKRVQSTVSSINRAQAEVGDMECKKHALIHQIVGAQNQLKELQEELVEQYGTVDINITDGTINYKEDVEANS